MSGAFGSATFDEGSFFKPGQWRHRAGQLAPAGIASSLTALLTSLLVVGWWQYSASSAFEDASRSVAAVADARVDLSAAREAERQYRIAPRLEQRSTFNQAWTQAASTIRVVVNGSAPSDRELGPDPGMLGMKYAQTVNQLFSVIDSGNKAAVDAVDKVEVSPAYGAVDTALRGVATRWQSELRARGQRLDQVESTSFFVVPSIFTICVAVIAFFWSVHRACARHTEACQARQVSNVFHSERRFRSIVQNAPETILVCDAGGNITYANPSAEKSLNGAGTGLLGRPLVHLLPEDERISANDLLDQLRASSESGAGSATRLDTVVQDELGQWRQMVMTGVNMLMDPSVEGLVLTLRDITRRKDFERQLTQYALHDLATQLPNKVLFNDRLEQAMLRARRAKTMVGVLIVELSAEPGDVGAGSASLDDDLAVEAAWRLRSSVRAQDTVARVGETWFAVLLEGVSKEADLQPVATRLADQFAGPFRSNAEPCKLAWNVGMTAAAAGDGQNIGLFGRAELALGRARRVGSGRCITFNPSMNSAVLDRHELESDLRGADLARELRLHFQPIVDLSSGGVRGVEALVRWCHPVHGIVAPRDFLELSAEVGLILPLGRWVLEAACHQAAEWQKRLRLDPPVVLSVNLSNQEFYSETLPSYVAEALARSGLSPACLMLEVSEAVMMQNFGAALTRIWDLKALGVQLAMDNFGMGSLSLPYLRQLPLDLLKIDGSIVRGIDVEAEDNAKVQASIALGRSLGFQVLGEGIETVEQASSLLAWRCQLGQGFYYGKPEEREQAEALLRTPVLGSRASEQIKKPARPSWSIRRTEQDAVA